MRVTKFWARGYRSLRNVKLPALGPFVVLYGPNGSGKSNILDALQTFFRLIPLAVDTAFESTDEERRTSWDAGREAAKWIKPDEFYGREDTPAITLGASIEGFAEKIDIEIVFSSPREGQFNLRMSNLAIAEKEIEIPFSDPLIRDLLRVTAKGGVTHLGVSRTLAGIPGNELVNELFFAKNSHDRETRERFVEVQQFIQTTLGHRIDVYVNDDKQVELRETLPAPNPHGVEIRVEHSGHGLIQMYAILASILLAEGQLVALEEPEAHLHAPTMGRQLRKILHDMVMKDDRIDQLFVATHSNLFDFDEDGYWDVALENGETVVRRKPLDEIDRAHLYEPGPAKHQLQEMLRLYGDDVVFHTASGRSLTAQEMLVSLQNDDDIAVAFLRTLHAAALEATGLDAMRESGDA